MMRPQAGVALDAGGAVGRFAFEMSERCDFAIGIDTSVAFIRAARQLMQERSLTFALKEEGQLGREATIRLPDSWRSERVDFLVANALALPLRKDAIGLFASLNLVDKVPAPLDHLREMNRVTRDREAQFLLSDPFSWSVEAAPAEAWLGGTAGGRFAGRGQANIASLLADPAGELAPVWQVDETGHVWWKIRTHANHYELIRSCFIRACR
jgi:SAM-dependent methyltransferase